MIDQIKIISKNGINMFSGYIEYAGQSPFKEETDTNLFAGFISAILSISEETQNAEIREIAYKEHNIVFVPTEELVFLGFANTKVPTKEVEELLELISNKWIKQFGDQEYPMITDEMYKQIKLIVQESAEELFWWLNPEYNLPNNIKLLKSCLTNPGSTYYVSFLPRSFLYTGLLMFVLTLLIGQAFGAYYGGGFFLQIGRQGLLKAFIPLFTLLIGTPLIMEFMHRNKFDLIGYLILSGIYFLIIGALLFLSSSVYYDYIYDNLALLVDSNYNTSTHTFPSSRAADIDVIIFESFLAVAPLNVCFFGYVAVLAYSGSFVTRIGTLRYYIVYLFAQVLMISVGTIIVSELLTG